MIVALSFERYFTYCHPEKAKWLCTRTVAKIVVILLTIFSILCTIPVFMEHEWNLDGTVQEASIRKNTFYEKSIRTWMNSATRFFIPTLCLLIFNYQIIKKVSCLTCHQIRHLVYLLIFCNIYISDKNSLCECFNDESS